MVVRLSHSRYEHMRKISPLSTHTHMEAFAHQHRLHVDTPLTIQRDTNTFTHVHTHTTLNTRTTRTNSFKRNFLYLCVFYLDLNLLFFSRL